MDPVIWKIISNKNLTPSICSLRSLVSQKTTERGLIFNSQRKLFQRAKKKKSDRMMYDTIFFTNLSHLNMIMMLFQ